MLSVFNMLFNMLNILNMFENTLQSQVNRDGKILVFIILLEFKICSIATTRGSMLFIFIIKDIKRDKVIFSLKASHSLRWYECNNMY